MTSNFAFCFLLTVLLIPGCQEKEKKAKIQQATPRKQPGAEIALYAPEQHDLYDGHFQLSAGRLYQVGRLNDSPGWEHMGNDASNVHQVAGTVEIAVDEKIGRAHV